MEKVTFKIVSAQEDYKALLKYNMFRKKTVPVAGAIGTAIAVVALAGSALHLFPIPMILYYFSIAWLLLVGFFAITIFSQVRGTSKAAQALEVLLRKLESGKTAILDGVKETEPEVYVP